MSEKKPILIARDPITNEEIPILTLQGKSAYDFAREGGYLGTTADFAQALSFFSGGFDWEWVNGTITGPSANIYFGDNFIKNIKTVPAASLDTSGILTTSAQNISGNKYFYNNIYLQRRLEEDDTIPTSLIFNPNYKTASGEMKQPSSSAFIKAYDDHDQNSYGSHLIIQGGASTIIGGGESPEGFYEKNFKELQLNDAGSSINANPESLYLIADRNICLITGNASTISSAFPPNIDSKTLYIESGNILADKIQTKLIQSNLILDNDIEGTNTTPSTAAGNIILAGPCYNRGNDTLLQFGDPGPQITFKRFLSDTSSGISLIFSTHDQVYAGNSLSIVSNEDSMIFVPNLTITTKTNKIFTTADTNDLNESGLTIVATSSVNNGRGRLGVKKSEVTGHRAIYLSSFTTEKIVQVVLAHGSEDNPAFYPVVMKDGAVVGTTPMNLGSSDNFTWNNVYAKKSMIETSDARLKNILPFDTHLKYLLQMYERIQPVAYTWKNLSSEDSHDRVHVGLLSQNVEEELLKVNLTDLDFGGLCKDPEYNEAKELIDYNYSLRYGEFHGLHILKNQQQDARLTELENKNKELENTISTLKTQVELLKLAIGG